MNKLGLRAGDWVEVRSVEEILATLDGDGCLDGLPFMPEMLQYCGKRFRVFKSAHKTCDTIETYTIRRLTDTVHLEGLRCDGGAHDGCQAGCLLFWKEAWLKPVHSPQSRDQRRAAKSEASGCDVATLLRGTRASVAGETGNGERYRCQATELLAATAPGHWWDLRQYVRDVTSKNVRLRDLLRYGLTAAFNIVMRWPIMRSYWRLNPWLQGPPMGGQTYPYLRGLAGDKTPHAVLNLQPGELVQVRSKREILRTLNGKLWNRGLYFDFEMVPYCGKTFRVLRRIERFIDHETGQMRPLRNICLILDGVTCSGCLSRNRLFCPRSLYPYWHEIWLKRVEDLKGSLDTSAAGPAPSSLSGAARAPK